jgi:hypothetical protein
MVVKLKLTQRSSWSSLKEDLSIDVTFYSLVNLVRQSLSAKVKMNHNLFKVVFTVKNKLEFTRKAKRIFSFSRKYKVGEVGLVSRLFT